MFNLILAIMSGSEGQSDLRLLTAAAGLSLLSLPFLKKLKRNILFKLLFKKGTKKRAFRTRLGGIFLALLLILGTGLLIGLLFDWTIVLWVLIGLLGLVLIFGLNGWKTPKPGKPETPEQRDRRLRQERETREFWRKKNGY